MKKPSLIVLLFLSFLSVRGQSWIYQPFPSSMTIYVTTQTDYSSPPSVYNTYRTEIVGDTIIGAYTYQKLYSGTGPFSVSGAVRNDVLNKKVFLYSVSTGMETLLYDFNLAVGDTVNRYNGYGFYQPLVAGAVSGSPLVKIDTAWVTSIDSVMLPHDGLYHKRFNFSGTMKNIDPDSADVEVSTSNSGPYPGAAGYNVSITLRPLIEGVGQIYNPISYYHFFEYQWNYYLNCATVNGLPYVTLGAAYPPFVNPALCNSIYTGIEEATNGNIFILSPNPTSSFLHIQGLREIHSVQVSDVLGRIVYDVEINSAAMEIDLSECKSGIYFVRISTADGKYIAKRVLKQ